MKYELEHKVRAGQLKERTLLTAIGQCLSFGTNIQMRVVYSTSAMALCNSLNERGPFLSCTYVPCEYPVLKLKKKEKNYFLLKRNEKWVEFDSEVPTFLPEALPVSEMLFPFSLCSFGFLFAA